MSSAVTAVGKKPPSGKGSPPIRNLTKRPTPLSNILTRPFLAGEEDLEEDVQQALDLFRERRKRNKTDPSWQRRAKEWLKVKQEILVHGPHFNFNIEGSEVETSEGGESSTKEKSAGDASEGPAESVEHV